MIDINILKSPEYKDLLVKTFDIAPFFSNDVFIEPEFLEHLNENKESDTFADPYFREIHILNNITWLYTIDNVPVGLFKDLYMVKFIEGSYSFSFCGDSLSNWMPYAFGDWTRKYLPEFQKICLERYNTPITEYDPYQDLQLYE